ncbi:MAG: phosphoribosylformylglycinamidine synthase subunit PurQ [Alphaproteobacteria bacterium]
MTATIIVFPGSNCDRDVKVALSRSLGREPRMVWHGDSELGDSRLIVLPGGFSYGDYLRSGAIAAQSPAMREVVRRARAGVPVLGICNGFQILTEAGLLPGALLRNVGLRFICRRVTLRVDNAECPLTRGYDEGQLIRLPIAHHDGNYHADGETLERLEGEGRIAFRYATPDGAATAEANPNGSARNIAGIVNEAGNVLGMMPHPERAADPLLGGSDGRPMFDALARALAP